MRGTHIYVGNIHPKTTPDDLNVLFGAHGQVLAAWIPPDPHTGRPLAFGFVELAGDVENAIASLDGTTFRGRQLKVTLASSTSDDERDEQLSVILDRIREQEHAPESSEFRAAFADLQALAETGFDRAAEELASIYAFDPHFYDPELSYKWYYIAYAQRDHNSIRFDNVDGDDGHYCGALGDFRNEAMVSELVDNLGFDKVQQLDAEAAQWMAERNIQPG